MNFQTSQALLAQAAEAIAPIEAALARFDSPANTLERDNLSARELMPLLDAHGRLFHSLLRGEISAIEAAGDVALTPFIASANARAKAIEYFDFIHRFQHLRDSLSAGPHNADTLLRKAASLFRDFTTTAANLTNP